MGCDNGSVEEVRVIVCGGRDYADEAKVYSTLDRVLAKYGDDLVIITGSCPTGADFLAEQWAKDREVEYMGFPAKWKRIGNKSAGYERNKRMRDKSQPEAAIAFPGGDGTEMMCRLISELGFEPWRIA